MRFNLSNNIQSQKGAALLAFVLVLITGSSFFLLTKLNATIRNRDDVEKTYDVLQRAKEALIGYAVSYPEINGGATTLGPGYLPCPDRDPPGTVNGSGEAGVSAFSPTGGVCAFGTALNSSLGRLPFLTIGMTDAVDDSGETLWYALSNDFRHSVLPPAILAPLNSDTVFNNPLALDGNSDIVAVIIAPGAPLDAPIDNTGAIGARQDRAVAANLINPIHYLEGLNYDNNANFESNNLNANNSNFNDRVIAITRQELMSAVEKRVLGEVSRIFNTYRNSFGANNQALPWLSPFTNPAVSNYLGVVGPHPALANNQGYTGHLPMHGFAAGANYINNATTGFSANWSIPTTVEAIPDAITYTGNHDNNQKNNCILNSDCDDENYQSMPTINNPINNNNINCRWVNIITFNCSATYVLPGGAQTWSGNGGGNDIVTRTHTIVYTDDLSNITFSPPTNTSLRRRNLNVRNNLAGTLSMTITDTDSAGNEIGTVVLDLDAGNYPGLVLNLNSVDYHLDTTGLDLDGNGLFFDIVGGINEMPPEVPTWFTANNWHQLVYIAYPGSELVPGANNPSPGTGDDVNVCNASCISLSSIQNGASNVVSNNQIRAIAVIAGGDLSFAGGATDRPNANFNDYYEGLNADLNPLTFERQLIPGNNLLIGNNNDLVRILLTNTTQ